ncbi:MAG: carbohydrate-binding domain-containing protein, partial [Erysipelotrichaceae bacterium]|nr:carbohydrate-binding domain-containing protein [Erysipelotrichaceae bacterium]
MKKMICVMTFLLLLCGCSTVIVDNTDKDSEDAATAYNLSFSEEDIDAGYQISGSTYITLGDKDVSITKGGTYILQGTLSDASVIVEVSKDEDVQLVLSGVTIEAGDFAGIYIVEGDEITITLAEGTVNTISDSSVHKQIDSNDVDALIYSKADLII